MKRSRTFLPRDFVHERDCVWISQTWRVWSRAKEIGATERRVGVEHLATSLEASVQLMCSEEMGEMQGAKQNQWFI